MRRNGPICSQTASIPYQNGPFCYQEEPPFFCQKNGKTIAVTRG